MVLMIQVLSGIFRHRRLILPKGDKTRPTTSQMRQAVFNIAQNVVEDATFLDICAGSGSMGIEALSRGAKSATFIDSSHFAIEAIRENLKSLHLDSEVLSNDAISSLKKLQNLNREFSLIYFDPPYTQEKGHSTLTEEVLHLLDDSRLLSKDGLLFMEESAKFSLDELNLKNLILISKRRFGNSYLYELGRSTV